VRSPRQGGAIVAVAPQPAAWRRHEDALAERITALHDTVSDALDGEKHVGVISRLIDGDLTGAVASLTAWCVDHLTILAPTARVGTDEELHAVLRQLRSLRQDVTDHDVDLHARRLADASGALRRLGATATSAELVDQACEQLVRRCGFGRAVLSRVETETWRPWMAHFTGPAVDASWFGEWIDRPIPLDDLVVETDVFAGHRPAVVPDTGDPRVYRPIIVDAGRSTSYVVAPVVLADDVVGFFHADHGPSRRRSGLVDRDVLWTFAQGFSLAYERVVLAERVEAQRERLRRALGSVEGLVEARRPVHDLALAGDDDLRSGDIPTIGGNGGATARPQYEELTDREHQVLSLLAVGATNAGIADKLVVSESTVKSHVRHILRKVGAANRAQAISRYLGVAPLDGQTAP
jgi:DNA-binding CsgD family transcriptional regulator